MKYKCPVCGYRGLRDKPYNKDGNGYKWFSKRTSPPEGWNPKENVPDKILKGEDALEIATQILKVNSDSNAAKPINTVNAKNIFETCSPF